MFLLINLIISKNAAILLNASKDFSNYRHSTNIYLFYDILIRGGFTENEIIYLTAEDVFYDKRNTQKGKAFYGENEYLNIPKTKTSKINVNSFLNILECNHPKLYELDKKSNVFIYMCGHGGDGFLKFLDREFLLKDDLMYGINKMARRVKKVFLVLDTCQAETIVDEKINENVFVFASSKKGQPSISFAANNKVGCAVVDSFPRLFYDKFEDGNCFIEDFVKEFTKEKLGSEFNIFGKKKVFLINDFFVQVGNEKDEL